MIKKDNDDEIKKCKGIKKSVVNDEISFKDYEDCLFSGNKQTKKMNVIRSYKHEFFSESINKIALCYKDDKRIS